VTQLIEVDELTRGDHWYLTADDHCFFIGEYTVGGGWQASTTNQRIFNLKKSPELKNTFQWTHKVRAIREAADDFRAAIDLATLEGVTVVPMPPSKARTHPLYDDRMVQIVRLLCQDTQADGRELLYQAESRDSFHGSTGRRDVEGLIENFRIDETLADPPPGFVVVVDDVLTTGASYRAAKTALQRRYGAALAVIGLFVARRIPRRDDPPDSED
jgi:predicted amidophosphoribosyltransferase